MNKKEFEQRITEITDLKELENEAKKVQAAFATKKIDSAIYRQMAEIIIKRKNELQNKFQDNKANKNNDLEDR